SKIIEDSSDKDLKLEKLSFEAHLTIEKGNESIIISENLNNVDDPKNWSSKRKGFILAIVTFSALSTSIDGT
ncbi:7489_t:CDS:2, partial [Scutellospora calospora]